MEEHAGGSVPMYSIVGGKLTTCRSLAEQSAATILKRLGRSPAANSRQRPIPGGESYPADETELQTVWQRLAARFQLPLGSVQSIWTLCGSRTEAVLAELDDLTGPCLAGTLLPTSFVRWVIRHEWVTTLDDLIERRLMLLYDPNVSPSTMDELAGLLVESGTLTAADLPRAVSATCRRLREHFGKRLRGMASTARNILEE
jgi:glycerol-3-phosphate dehydrogenase